MQTILMSDLATTLSRTLARIHTLPAYALQHLAGLCEPLGDYLSVLEREHADGLALQAPYVCRACERQRRETRFESIWELIRHQRAHRRAVVAVAVIVTARGQQPVTALLPQALRWRGKAGR